MRVATRRQRAAWRVFGDAFDQSARLATSGGSRRSPRDLGAVRDLDVLIEAGEAYQQASSPRRTGRRSSRCSTTWRAPARRRAGRARRRARQ